MRPAVLLPDLARADLADGVWGSDLARTEFRRGVAASDLARAESRHGVWALHLVQPRLAREKAHRKLASPRWDGALTRLRCPGLGAAWAVTWIRTEKSILDRADVTGFSMDPNLDRVEKSVNMENPNSPEIQENSFSPALKRDWSARRAATQRRAPERPSGPTSLNGRR